MGNAEKASVNAYGGIVRSFVTVPGVGDVAPTVNYDVAVNCGFGFDVLGGQGVMRKLVAETTKDDRDFRYFAASALTLVVTNAGPAKQGVVHLVILGL